MALSLNDPAPPFELDGVQRGGVKRFRMSDFRSSWLVLFFYPADFTFVCPTEVKGFERRHAEFEREDARVVAVSVDDINSHAEWVKELGGLSYPVLADTDRSLSKAYGVLNAEDGRAFRATFIISPDGRLAYMAVSPMNVGRSVEETLRVLRALRSGRLCPADWKPGDPTMEPDLRY